MTDSNPKPYMTVAVTLPKEFFRTRIRRRVSLSDFTPHVPSASDAAVKKLICEHTINVQDVSGKTANPAI